MWNMTRSIGGIPIIRELAGDNSPIRSHNSALSGAFVDIIDLFHVTGH